MAIRLKDTAKRHHRTDSRKAMVNHHMADNHNFNKVA
jgi:hypothetical protein